MTKEYDQGWAPKPDEVALLKEELGSTGEVVVTHLTDGTEILAAAAYQHIPIMDREYDYAGIELTENLKAAFISGEMCVHEILNQTGVQLYALSHVAGAKGWGFSCKKVDYHHTSIPRGLTAQELGYTGGPYEGRTPLEEVLANIPESGRKTAERILRPLEEDYQAAMGVLGVRM